MEIVEKQCSLCRTEFYYDIINKRPEVDNLCPKCHYGSFYLDAELISNMNKQIYFMQQSINTWIEKTRELEAKIDALSNKS